MQLEQCDRYDILEDKELYNMVAAIYYTHYFKNQYD